MNAWLPQASHPCGNFSGTSSLQMQNAMEKKNLKSVAVRIAEGLDIFVNSLFSFI